MTANNSPRHSFEAATWFLGRPGRVYIERYARRSDGTRTRRPAR